MVLRGRIISAPTLGAVRIRRGSAKKRSAFCAGHREGQAPPLWFSLLLMDSVLSLPRGHLLFAQGNIVCDHCDALGICGFSLHIADRIAENALEGLDVAAVPGDLDGVADFRDFRPELGDALRRICEGFQPLDSLACS